ncbi:MAG: hypothetical protein J3Q66DRAFT_371402 [Benniella sp.]|nr:MAG: hypothetical protein J3Q66DRAFT_371402 [Benniella sp.]
MNARCNILALKECASIEATSVLIHAPATGVSLLGLLPRESRLDQSPGDREDPSDQGAAVVPLQKALEYLLCDFVEVWVEVGQDVLTELWSVEKPDVEATALGGVVAVESGHNRRSPSLDLSNLMHTVMFCSLEGEKEEKETPLVITFAFQLVLTGPPWSSLVPLACLQTQWNQHRYHIEASMNMFTLPNSIRMKLGDITKELGIPLTTIMDIVQKAETRGSCAPARRLGGPLKMTIRDKRALLRNVMRNRRSSLNELAASRQISAASSCACAAPTGVKLYG